MQIYVSKGQDQKKKRNEHGLLQICKWGYHGGGLCKWAFLFILPQKIMHLIF
jgi:hypothetical protein